MDESWAIVLSAIITAVPSCAAWFSAERAHRASKVNTETLKDVVHNTNGMSQKIEAMARAEGVAEGKETQRAETLEKST
jgi:hypothetical protein